MKRPTLNLVIDSCIFLNFLLMAATGLVLKYILPPGTGRIRGAGMKEFFGVTRHDWGDVHFYLSLVFLGLILIHLSLHWNWIKAMLTKPLSSTRPTTA